MNENICFSCLAESKNNFCSRCARELFGGRKVSAFLPFTYADFVDLKIRAGRRISISGVQVKHSLALTKNKLMLTETGGGYIIKPVPGGNLRHLNQLPANEHITMQIARQVFGINVAPNALCFFSSESPAYITKRFDITGEGKKALVEDFAQISGRTAENAGDNYKYNASYEEIGKLIRKYVAASELETEKFLTLVLFNYVISNGDAHLKNFSLIRNDEYGDYLLTPAYDLVCTRLHLPYESDMALELFEDKYESEDYKAGSKHLAGDFILFGERLGLKPVIINNIINQFTSSYNQVENLVNRSFLTGELKHLYLSYFSNKLSRMT